MTTCVWRYKRITYCEPRKATSNQNANPCMDPVWVIV